MMSKKINNKSLLIVLALLVAILAIARLAGSKKNTRTLNTELVKIDTARITSLLLYPGGGEEISFTKTKGLWKVSKDGIIATGDQRMIKNALSELSQVRPNRLVSRDQERWPAYQVYDSTGTRIVIREGKKTTLDLVIGKFDYKPPAGENQYYGQQQFSGETYVRKTSEDEVYSVEGFLGLSFNRDFNSWRNQAVTRINPSQITKFSFSYPADSGFIAQKTDAGAWIIAGLPADSAKVADYFSNIRNKRNNSFIDGFTRPVSADYRLTLEGENMPSMVISAYTLPDGDLAINSSLNAESWFRTGRDGLFGDLFKRPEDFYTETNDPGV